jgi:NAD-dependent dihydropyrimidine dehydrogenase PreA subunit
MAHSPYLIVEPECIACGWCKYNCPVADCITFDSPIAQINDATCIECDRCIYVCPVNVIKPLREPQPRRQDAG